MLVMVSHRHETSGRQRGFTILELMIVVAVLAIVMSMALPSFLNARMAANESGAISNLNTLRTANEQYRVRFLAYADIITRLSQMGYVESGVTDGLKSGYTYVYTATNYTFAVTAGPETPGQSGHRYFFISDGGMITFSTTGTATSADAPVDG